MDLSFKTEQFGQDDQSWLASADGTDYAASITLAFASFTEATHYPDGWFRSGTPLGLITASKKHGPYDNAAVDGRQTLVGFLLEPLAAPRDGVSDVHGALLERGKVKPARLPIPVDAAGQAELAGHFIFVED